MQKYMTNNSYPASNSDLNRRYIERIINEIYKLVEAIKSPIVYIILYFICI